MSSLHGSKRVVRKQVVSSLFITKLRDSLIPALVSAGLEFDVYGIEASNLPTEVSKVTKALASPIVIVMHDVEQAMAKLGHHCIEENSKCNDEFKDTIIKHLNKLVEILGDKESSTRQKLSKQHKDGEKVLCLIREPNSGKTSLFTPISHVIPQRYSAMVTKQKKFNKSMIDKATQVIFLDEAYAKLLDPDDWKVLTQGGLTAHDRKFSLSTPLNIKCLIFISCQRVMDFGENTTRQWMFVYANSSLGKSHRLRGFKNF
ncbi:uncharacterized protein LOC144648288 [Oculina patagonica]